MTRVYLNLGCYDKPFPRPFINVGNFDGEYVDIVDNCLELGRFNEDSVDIIYCSNLFVQFTFDEAKIALRRWFSVLKNNGIVRLSVPDLNFYLLNNHIDFSLVQKMFYGSFESTYKSGYTKSSLSKVLSECGYSMVRMWDRQSTFPFYYINDLDLSSYLQVLNIEGTKHV